MLSRRVLIIEDDADAAGVLEAYLRRENYDVVITGDGLSGLDMAHRWKPDLILLDWMLPGLNGTEVLAGLRRKNDVPVIMVTAMGDTPDRIGALRYGADDYIVKPFSPGEVMARMKAVLRRIEKSENVNEQVLNVENLTINLADYSVKIDSKAVALTKREVDMLWTLAKGRNRAYSREMLLDQLWGYDYYGDPRTVDSHMKRLRAKLDTVAHPSWEIRTIRNVGYKFEVLNEK